MAVMVIREGSDFHSEFYKWKEVPLKSKEFNSYTFLAKMENEKEQTLLIPGDICFAKEIPVAFFQELSDRFKYVILVPGNHESYHFSIEETVPRFKRVLAHLTNIFILDDEVVELDGVVFIGSTLWTDFHKGNLTGMFCAKHGMPDFRTITFKNRIWTPEDSMNKHEVSKAFIKIALENAKRDGKKAVVATHHAPSFMSIHEKYKRAPYSDLNPAFSSDLFDLIFDHGPSVWFHGHMHDNFDYVIGETRVIVNPFGYIRNNGKENPGYIPNLTVEINLDD